MADDRVPSETEALMAAQDLEAQEVSVKQRAAAAVTVTRSPSVSASVSASAPSPVDAAPSLCQFLWSVAFYAPAFAFPAITRVLLVYRNAQTLGVANVIKGAFFGVTQDAAIFLQTLLLVRVVLGLRRPLRDALDRKRDDAPDSVAAKLLAVALESWAFGSLCAAYLWMALAGLVDMALLVRYLPRINRGFVEMYLNFTSQFTSSLEEVISLSIVIIFSVHTLFMLLWATAVLGRKVELPSFGLLFCQSPPPRKGASSAPKGPTPTPPPPSSRAAVGCFAAGMHVLGTSAIVRTFLVGLMVYVAALHSSIALDGNGNDIYLMSNAMYSLQMEEYLRSPTKAHAALITNQKNGENAGDLTGNGASKFDFLSTMIGDLEVHEPPAEAKYPFWRKTLGFKGPKRFEFLPTADDKHAHASNKTRPSTPPNILLINVESFRSREVGVIGGRHKKAKYNQTVTPFLDELSRSGVLFREHYTPCIQTSRSLLSTLFGILPSWTGESAVSKHRKRKYHLRSIMQILKEQRGYENVFWSAVDLGWEDWRGFLRDHGFDDLYDDKSIVSMLTPEVRKSMRKDEKFSWGIHDRISLSALVNYLEKRQSKQTEGEKLAPLFMDIYTISSHDPWHVPGNYEPSSNFSVFLTEHNKRYVNALNYADQQLEKLFANLRSRGLLNNTIVLIEGDHGHGFMEHNNPSVTTSKIYDEMLHIPLMLVADDLLDESSRGVVVDETTSALDLLSTFADMLGIENFMQHGMGQSLMRRRHAPGEAVPIEMDRPVFLENPYEAGTQGMRRADLKYAIFGSGHYVVYNMTADPWEERPVEEGKSKDVVADSATGRALGLVERVIANAQELFQQNVFKPKSA
ncbi:hypothetical protein P43SY_011396 [Pythium insidiosum]|uniref:Sulfatase N-terminal domain-containing protein n=1 Tax=Pythium insidiosum TaxID=114742 RepID=A0AAD5Q5H0_PYTIN|nr:hypothetical protein P43SY_011396 [Pythium insidiosum]